MDKENETTFRQVLGVIFVRMNAESVKSKLNWLYVEQKEHSCYWLRLCAAVQLPRFHQSGSNSIC